MQGQTGGGEGGLAWLLFEKDMACVHPCARYEIEVSQPLEQQPTHHLAPPTPPSPAGVLICTPKQAKACATGATCSPIQGVGICVYPA